MLRNMITYLVMALLFGWVTGAMTGAAPSGQAVEISDSAGVHHPEEDEETLQDLSDQIRLWHVAILTGSEDRAQVLEEEILRAIRSDLKEMETAVKKQATRVALSETHSSIEGEADLDDDRKVWQQTLALLREKAQKSQAIEETQATCNKFRLISDYVDLLRKQLGMPKVKLASQNELVQEYPGIRATE